MYLSMHNQNVITILNNQDRDIPQTLVRQKLAERSNTYVSVASNIDKAITELPTIIKRPWTFLTPCCRYKMKNIMLLSMVTLGNKSIMTTVKYLIQLRVFSLSTRLKSVELTVKLELFIYNEKYTQVLKATIYGTLSIFHGLINNCKKEVYCKAVARRRDGCNCIPIFLIFF